MKPSGLQKEVIALYRDFLRAVRRKPVFRHDATHISRKDFTTIEFLLRKGRKQLETLKNPNVVDIS
eukprot:jgi/Hompol1/222/HPOL_000677-RA